MSKCDILPAATGNEQKTPATAAFLLFFVLISMFYFIVLSLFDNVLLLFFNVFFLGGRFLWAAKSQLAARNRHLSSSTREVVSRRSKDISQLGSCLPKTK